MHCGMLLSNPRAGCVAGFVDLGPPGEQGLAAALPVALLPHGLGMPPPVRRVEGFASPPSYDLGLVTVVEAIEHHVHAGFATSTTHLQSVLDRADAPGHGLAVLGALPQLVLERFDLGGRRVCCEIGRAHV